MKKGELWWADLNPVKGSEQQGKRPVAIVSGDLLNTYSPVVWICPLSSKIKRYKGNVILAPTAKNGLQKAFEIMNLHLRSVSKERLVEKMGELSAEELSIIRHGIAEILKMD
jgi:mRNA interferase MazF